MKKDLYYLTALVSVFLMSLIFAFATIIVMQNMLKEKAKPEYKIELLTFPNIKVESSGEIHQMEVYDLEQFMLTNEL